MAPDTEELLTDSSLQNQLAQDTSAPTFLKASANEDGQPGRP